MGGWRLGQRQLSERVPSATEGAYATAPRREPWCLGVSAPGGRTWTGCDPARVIVARNSYITPNLNGPFETFTDPIALFSHYLRSSNVFC